MPSVTAHPKPSGVDARAVRRFWRFVHDRHSVWHRRFVWKEAEPLWTDDPILKRERFTNVYRALDRGTQFAVSILENMGGNNRRLDAIAFGHLLVYRWFNRIETYTRLLPALSLNGPPSVKRLLENIEAEGLPLRTGAYVSCATPWPHKGTRLDRYAYQIEYLLAAAPHYLDAIRSETDPRDVHVDLQAIVGVGQFLSYQLMGDMRLPLRSRDGAPFLDVDTSAWVHLGAGGMKGARLIRPGATRAAALEAVLWLHRTQTLHPEMRDFPFLENERDDVNVYLSTHDVEHCLCEFYKYERMRNGGTGGRERWRGPRDGWRSEYLTLPAWSYPT